jgi:hypothetical protein
MMVSGAGGRYPSALWGRTVPLEVARAGGHDGARRMPARPTAPPPASTGYTLPLSRGGLTVPQKCFAKGAFGKLVHAQSREAGCGQGASAWVTLKASAGAGETLRGWSYRSTRESDRRGEEGGDDGQGDTRNLAHRTLYAYIDR